MTDQIAIIAARPNNLAYGPEDRAYLLAIVRDLREWASRSKVGYYDEAQDDVLQIIRDARGES